MSSIHSYRSKQFRTAPIALPEKTKQKKHIAEHCQQCAFTIFFILFITLYFMIFLPLTM